MNKLEYAADLIGRLSKKDHAELRRPGLSPALWKILASLNEAESEYHSTYEWEKRWSILLRSIALTGQGDSSEDDPSFGQALAQTGWSEGRLFRLLEAEDEALHDQMRFATAYLESKDARPDWTQAHDLLFYDNERARHAIARSYYHAHNASSEDDSDN
jgi:CRISPR system Cascade subunit CasB